MKKYPYLLLAVFGLLLIGRAARADDTSGDYLYTTTASGEAIITGYLGRDTHVSVPQSLNGHTVTGIGSGAFMNRDSLYEITLPDEITFIGEKAFWSCDRLLSVRLPKALQRIEDGAFSCCHSLLEIDLPESVQSVGEKAFSSCGSLFRVSLPDSVRRIGARAFSFCDSLETIALPGQITEIGDETFLACRFLTSVTVPEKLARVGSGAFAYCDHLTDIHLPAGVNSIGDAAFYECGRLLVLADPGSRAETYCQERNIALAYPNAPERVVSGKKWDIYVTPYSPGYIEKDGFWYILHEDGTAKIIFYKGAEQDLTIPAELDGHPVIAVGGYLTLDGDSLTSVVLPEGLLRIGNMAFPYCSRLSSVTLPQGLISIGSRAFATLKNMKSVSLPASLKYLADDAFEDCTASIEYAPGTELIKRQPRAAAADPKQSRADPEKPADFSRIFLWAFLVFLIGFFLYPKVRKKLRGGAPQRPEAVPAAPAYPQDAPEEPSSALEPERAAAPPEPARMQPLPEAQPAPAMPAAPRETPAAAAQAQPSVPPETAQAPLLPDAEPPRPAPAAPAPRGLGDYLWLPQPDGSAVLTGFTGLSRVVFIPDQLEGHPVKAIGDNAFSGREDLISVTLPRGLARVGSLAFAGCESLTMITLPDSLTQIGANPFARCGRLTTILASSDHPAVYTDGGALFGREEKKLICYPCALGAEHYSVPEGTAAIGEQAFARCGSLNTVRLPASVTRIAPDAFLGCDRLSLLVPAGSVAERYCLDNGLSFRRDG